MTDTLLKDLIDHAQDRIEKAIGDSLRFIDDDNERVILALNICASITAISARLAQVAFDNAHPGQPPLDFMEGVRGVIMKVHEILESSKIPNDWLRKEADNVTK